MKQTEQEKYYALINEKLAKRKARRQAIFTWFMTHADKYVIYPIFALLFSFLLFVVIIMVCKLIVIVGIHAINHDVWWVGGK